MTEYSATIPSRTIGIDLGDQYSHFFVLDEAGQEVESGRVATSQAGMKKFKGMERARIVIEVGTHSPWVSRKLEEWGHEVVVANARQVHLISKNDRKSDRVDPELLARLGRMDTKLLRPLRHRAAKGQADLAVLRSRDALVQGRSALINHVRGSVKSWGARIRKGSAEGFHKRVGDIPEALQPALKPVMQTIERLTQEIRQYDRKVEKMGEAEYPETAQLRQITGVGPLTSLAYVLTLEDPHRFPKGRTVGRYLGLTPKQSDSGDQAPQLRISKAGDRMLRRLLVSSGQYILGPFGPDCDLRRWGMQRYERGGKNAKKRAVVAVARKLAVLLHRLWVSGEQYDPWRHHRGQPPVVEAVA
ncbi:MAG: IS110 family transposase [Acidobacteria bacterium]|nr:IS110 family transposase [Acidobacteriota bacterium]